MNDLDYRAATNPTDFDAGVWMGIVYGKGASINRMFATYIGDEWNIVLGNHIASYQFTNPSVADLLTSLEQFSSRSGVGVQMGEWLYNSGFPVVLATNHSTYLNITQYPISPLLPPRQRWYEI